VELRGRGKDRLEGHLGEPGEPLERIAHPLLLRRDLRLVGEILKAAATAGGIVRTGRVDPLRA